MVETLVPPASDEKLWVDKFRPNKQNERYWAEENSEVEVDCREQGVKKVMCWVDQWADHLDWFPVGTTVNQHVYQSSLYQI